MALETNTHQQCDQVKPVCGSCKRRRNPSECNYGNAPFSSSAADNPVLSGEDDDHRSRLNSITTPKGHNGDALPSMDGLQQLNARIKMLETALSAKAASKTTPTHSHSDNNTSRIVPSIHTNSLSSSSTHTASSYLVENNDDDVVLFHQDSFPTPLIMYQGALTWVSLLRKDMFLNSMMLSITSRKKLLAQETQNDPKYKEFSKTHAKYTESGAENLKDVADMPIVPLVRGFLADTKLVWILIDRFFDSEMGLIFPVLQRDEFEHQVATIVDARGCIHARLNFNKRAQCAIVGILLLVMRLASLSLHSSDLPIDAQLTQDEKYMLMNPVSEKVMQGVDKCIEEVEKLKEVTIPIFQLTVLKRYYELIAPEEADCISVTTPGRLGQLLHHALQCSINRDPDRLPNGFPIAKNFGRRLWFMVVQLDLQQLMVTGGHSLVHKEMYDTELPHLDESETPIEFAIDKSIVDFGKTSELLYGLLNDILNVRAPPKVGELKQRLRPLEDFIANLPTVKQILMRPRDTVVQRVAKIRLISQLMDCASLLCMIYYHLFLHYCSKMDKDMAVYYSIEILKWGSLLYPIVLFFDKNNTEYDMAKHFGGSQLLIPKFEMTLHRLEQLFFSIAGRIKIFKLTTSDINLVKIAAIDKLYDVLMVSMKHILNALKVMAGSYYHAWVISKIHTFIISRLLYAPHGLYLTPAPLDLEILASYSSRAPSDDVFFHFTTQDFERISSALAPYQEVDIAGSTTDSPLDGAMMFDDNDRWMRQVVQDLANAERDGYFTNKHNHTGTTPTGPPQGPLLPTGMDPADSVSSGTTDGFFEFPMTGNGIEEFLFKQSAAEYGMHL